MDIETMFDDDLARRLPLPLAQLYRRAHNAKGPRDRHDTAYCLWEAALKLLGATAVVAYAERGAPAPELAERLRNLARPALGHWWEFVRLLLSVLADAGDESFRATRDLVLGRARDDLPRAAGLDAALRETLDGAAGARVTVRLSELFDRLVRYRNRELGHGAAGQRPGEFYDRMGLALRLGVPELLGRLDVLAGRRLIAVTDVRAQTSGAWLVERYELVGEAPRRLESRERPESEATCLPRPGRLYLVAPGPSAVDGPAWSLHPLVLYDHEAEEVFFLNARRGRRRTEYLCYYPGRTMERPDLGGERRALLAQVLGETVDEGQAEQWAARSQAEEPPGPPEPVEAPRRLGEFELLSELGRGGMGVVYRAWQPSLGRHVALKSLIRAGDPKAEARFNREIHALGRVEHPNLVKVFTSGAEVDRWFYAMELIEGATLGTVCGRLQGRGSTVTQLDLAAWRETVGSACQDARAAERPLGAAQPAVDRPARPRPESHPSSGIAGRDYVRQVVELVRQVAEAAHALHEAGVVHRDIKPDNVMVTPDGTQAVLMDLGLAQLADEAEGRLTRTRQFLGTLRYASPEQIRAITRVDRRSDIYSLGATLWELLTLRPLFGATDATPTPELMETIQNTEPGSPRRSNPAVARDLEAIVLKCLEKDKARRYATAAELAADLGRFLGDEPVTARLSSPWELTVKWMRRRPTVAALSAAVVLVGVMGAAAASWQWRSAVANAREAKKNEQEALGARDEAERQRKEAKEQEQKALRARDEAQLSLRVACQGLDDLLTQVADVDLADIPEMEKTRRLLLEKAGDGCDKLRTQPGAERDPVMRRVAARAEARLGDVQALLGDVENAEKSYRRVIPQLEELLAESPVDRDVLRDLVRCHLGLGGLLKDEDRLKEATAELSAAEAHRAPLEASGDRDDRQLLAEIAYQYGVVMAREAAQRGLPMPASEAAYQEAIRRQKELVEQGQARAERQAKLGRYLNNLGKLLVEGGRPREAETYFRQAIDRVGDPGARDIPSRRWQYARNAYNLGTILVWRSEAEAEGLELMRKAKCLLLRLGEEFPDVPQYQKELALICSTLGQVLLPLKGRGDEARDDLKLAIDRSRRLVDRFPKVPSYRVIYARACLLRAKNLEGTDGNAARSAAREAIEQLEPIAERYPDAPSYQIELGRAYSRLAWYLREDPIEARTAAVRAVREHAAALESSPDSPNYRRDLRDDEFVLSEILLRLGEIEPAARAAEEIPRLLPDDFKSYLYAVALLTRCAAASKGAGPDYEARAVRALRTAVDRRVIRDPSQLRSPEFRALEGREDFRRLKASLAPPRVGYRSGPALAPHFPGDPT
jgi:serine/threonine protein kinase/tetratricopeptide (TPR) repeat protein